MDGWGGSTKGLLWLTSQCCEQQIYASILLCHLLPPLPACWGQHKLPPGATPCTGSASLHIATNMLYGTCVGFQIALPRCQKVVYLFSGIAKCPYHFSQHLWEISHLQEWLVGMAEQRKVVCVSSVELPRFSLWSCVKRPSPSRKKKIWKEALGALSIIFYIGVYACK